MACETCDWVRLFTSDHSSDGEAASLFTDWCPVCGSVRTIHEGDYSWWRKVYTRGSIEPALFEMPLDVLLKMEWKEVKALKDLSDHVLQEMVKPKPPVIDPELDRKMRASYEGKCRCHRPGWLGGSHDDPHCEYRNK